MSHRVQGANTCTLMREIQLGGVSISAALACLSLYKISVFERYSVWQLFQGTNPSFYLLIFSLFFCLQSFSRTGTQQQMGIYVPMPFFLTVPFATSVADNKEQGMLLDNEEITRNLIESYDGDMPFLSAINGFEILHCKMYG